MPNCCANDAMPDGTVYGFHCPRRRSAVISGTPQIIKQHGGPGREGGGGGGHTGERGEDPYCAEIGLVRELYVHKNKEKKNVFLNDVIPGLLDPHTGSSPLSPCAARRSFYAVPVYQ